MISVWLPSTSKSFALILPMAGLDFEFCHDRASKIRLRSGFAFKEVYAARLVLCFVR